MYEQIEPIYYFIVLLSMFFAFYRLGVTKYSVLIILVFWSGLFGFLGSGVFNIYQVVVFLYAFYLFLEKVFKKYHKIEVWVNAIFILFSISFWYSYAIHGGEILTILSQYFFKYGIPFLFFHGFKDVLFNIKKRERIKYLLLQVLFIQIFLSLAKLALFGFNVERNVGSIEYGSGAFAVVLPMACLFFYWVIKNNKLKDKDWIIIASFFIIAIASGKRAPVLMFPIFAFLLYYYAGGKFNIKSVLKFAPLLFLIFYLGIRLTPTLNPEREVWGTFDVGHVVEYSLNYNFGVRSFREIGLDSDLRGRGGGLFLVLQPERLGFSNTKELLFGHGLYEVAVREGGRFTGAGDYLLQHQGLVGELIRLFYSLGLFGLLSITLMGFIFLKTMKDIKLRRLLILYFIWDLFMYYNHFMFGNTSALIVIFTIFYRNSTHFKN